MNPFLVALSYPLVLVGIMLLAMREAGQWSRKGLSVLVRALHFAAYAVLVIILLVYVTVFFAYLRCCP